MSDGLVFAMLRLVLLHGVAYLPLAPAFGSMTLLEPELTCTGVDG